MHNAGNVIDAGTARHGKMMSETVGAQKTIDQGFALEPRDIAVKDSIANQAARRQKSRNSRNG